MKNSTLKPISVLIIALAVGAVGFIGGMKYSTYQLANTRSAAGYGNFQGTNGRGNGGMMGGRQGGLSGGGRILGSIVNMDGQSLTIKLADGSTKIVLFSDKTLVQKTSDTSRDELKTGMTVAAFGISNADGSVTAQSIQLNPQMGRFGGQAGESPTPTVSPTPAVK